MDDLPARMTPFQHMVALLPDASEAQRRARLGTLGFGADKADTEAQNLSGGEKARLLFALATFHAPHLLILDEPTNHLDVDSREALIRALGDYEGAVILISHDRHLVEASADRLWIVRNGTVRDYGGDIEQYRAECLAERGGVAMPEARGRSNGAAAADGATGTRLSPQEARRQAADKRAQLAPLKKRVTAAEKEIARLSGEMARIDRALADTGLYARDAARAQKLSVERGQLARQLAEAEVAWLAASEEYEGAAEAGGGPP
jgi:ATP-binding cassette subfamily F protein 3